MAAVTVAAPNSGTSPRGSLRQSPLSSRQSTTAIALTRNAQPCSVSATRAPRQPVIVRDSLQTAAQPAAEEQAATGLAAVLPSPPALVQTEARAFAPATVANLGPGFDFLGCAVEGQGDHVTATVEVRGRRERRKGRDRGGMKKVGLGLRRHWFEEGPPTILKHEVCFALTGTAFVAFL